jgi:hypothetical protein
MKTHSGDIKPDLQPEAIELRRGRVDGVRFAGRPEVVRCTHILCGMGADRVAQLIERGDEKVPRRLAEAAALKPAFWRYLLHLVAPIDALPDAFGRLAFAVRQPTGDLDGGNALALHLADGYGQHAVLSVEALASGAEPPSHASLVQLRSRVRDHLGDLLPFVDRHLLAIHSPHDGLPPEIEGSTDGEAAPAPITPEPVWSMPGQRTLGICGIPHATGVKHLLLASRQILPGLGLEGELTTGWGAARLVLQTEKKRDLVKGAVLESG